jgi:hypothetical protein
VRKKLKEKIKFFLRRRRSSSAATTSKCSFLALRKKQKQKKLAGPLSGSFRPNPMSQCMDGVESTLPRLVDKKRGKKSVKGARQGEEDVAFRSRFARRRTSQSRKKNEKLSPRLFPALRSNPVPQQYNG